MGCISTCRPRVPLEITIAHSWVPREEVESLVNATETLEIKRQGAGMTCTAAPTNGKTTIPSADQCEEKPAESDTTQSRVYYIQTKTLDRPVHYHNFGDSVTGAIVGWH
ncbi:hypothetical protein N7491_009844 [Penicillium cf. griseofulvum]|uniref:Uncharacterized protein n=1 Tax=Penicillium cf. griseofulvum TaxID=2972120 RepID=A0A9W9MYS4_9EURO|nr:hypothetical protein N7472_000170 [Penicillium cf. griseofulvum]KAJ5421399.1 hypothetical protein N7491_009844 [Penicillium cf. griseofulvum]KAJ5424630.1 hypothetical protein N7445_010603 [Penicillium cf. griseofulvum]